MPALRRLSAVMLCAWPLLCSRLHAQDLARTCHATSSYDMTLESNGLLFDRPSPSPQRVELVGGTLRTDGAEVPLSDDQRERLRAFETDLRALVPRARVVAEHGVDMAVQAIRAEAAGMGLDADTQAELARRLDAHARELHQRIMVSQSTHDWDGDAATRYANEMAGDIVPLVAAALGQQAVNAALSGDLQAAGDLRDRASSLATQIEPRLQRRMQALRPQIESLCPAIRQLAELQYGLHASNGRPLNLVQIGQ